MVGAINAGSDAFSSFSAAAKTAAQVRSLPFSQALFSAK